MGVDLFCRNCLVNGGSVDHCEDHFQVVSKVPATKRWISPQRDASHSVSRWDEPVPGVSKKTLCGVTHNYYIAIFGCFVLFHIILLTTFLNLEELTFKNEIRRRRLQNEDHITRRYLNGRIEEANFSS